MWIGFVYAIVAAAIAVFEFGRKKRIFYDQLSLLNIFFLANIAIPAATLHLLLDPGLGRTDGVYGFSLLGYLYHRAQPTERVILLFGYVLAYFALVFGYRLATHRASFSHQTAIRSNRRVPLVWVVIGFIFFGLMFVFGNSLVPGDPIQGLLLSTYYRAEDEFYAFERTPLNANIYAATTTFLLFSLVGVALATERRAFRWMYFGLTALFLFVDVVASGARRNLLIAALLIYCFYCIRTGKHKLYYLLIVLLFSAPLLYYGKAILRNLSSEDLPEKVAATSASVSVQVVTAAAEFGVSFVESIGTLALYHDGPRWGIDHILSVLRMIPFGMMGYEKPWPERIVRISTVYQCGDAFMQDIPPGYLGQCWIDIPFIGFFLMPLLHGACFGYVERAFRNIDVRRSPFYLIAYLVVGFIVAMPLNSGTLDYVCSPEIVLTVVLFAFLHFLNTRRLGLTAIKGNVVAPRSPWPASARESLH
jgi:hypothetical protein